LKVEISLGYEEGF